MIDRHRNGDARLEGNKDMFKRLTRALLVAIAVVLIPATVALAYLYSAPYTVTNNTSSSYAMLSTIAHSNNLWMVANGFMEADALDTRVQTLAGSAKPHLVTDNATLTAIPVADHSQTNLAFVTGESDLSAMYLIEGYGGYVTTTNATNLPGGNMWKFQAPVYLGSENSTILSKSLVMDWFWNTTTNNLTARAFAAASNLELIVDGAGDFTALAPSAGANWQCVNESYTAPNDGDFVQNNTAPYAGDAYTLQDGGAIPATAKINSVYVYYRAMRTPASDGYATPGLRLNGVSSNGTQVALGNAFANYTKIITRPGGGSWSNADIPNLQVVIYLADATDVVECSQISAVVNYSTAASLVSAITTEGEHTIALSDNSTHVALFVDDLVTPVSTNAWAGSLVSNGNSWVSLLNVPYAEYFKVLR